MPRSTRQNPNPSSNKLRSVQFMPGTMNQHYPNSSTSRSSSGRGSSRRMMLLLFTTASIINVLQLPSLSLALTTTSAFITTSSIMHQHRHYHHPHPIVLLSQRSTSSSSSSSSSMKCCHHHVDDDDDVNNEATNVDNINRRKFLKEKPALIVSSAIAAAAATAAADPAFAAATTKSRTDGYKVQHSDREWSYILSGQQYNVLRQGGTERQKSSILNTFTSKDHVGTYVCAGCNTPLFISESKFSSGTGWPSFAYSYTDSISNTRSDGGGGDKIGGVEIEQLDPIRSALNGREVRCNTCGGHLGDLFNDGYMYIGTSAFDSGQRYCIDGSALIFKPTSTTDGLVVKEGEDTRIFGDMPPPNKTIRYEQSMFRN